MVLKESGAEVGARNHRRLGALQLASRSAFEVCSCMRVWLCVRVGVGVGVGVCVLVCLCVGVGGCGSIGVYVCMCVCIIMTLIIIIIMCMNVSALFHYGPCCFVSILVGSIVARSHIINHITLMSPLPTLTSQISTHCVLLTSRPRPSSGHPRACLPCDAQTGCGSSEGRNLACR